MYFVSKRLAQQIKKSHTLGGIWLVCRSLATYVLPIIVQFRVPSLPHDGLHGVVSHLLIAIVSASWEILILVRPALDGTSIHAVVLAQRSLIHSTSIITAEQSPQTFGQHAQHTITHATGVLLRDDATHIQRVHQRALAVHSATNAKSKPLQHIAQRPASSAVPVTLSAIISATEATP